MKLPPDLKYVTAHRFYHSIPKRVKENWVWALMVVYLSLVLFDKSIPY